MFEPIIPAAPTMVNFSFVKNAIMYNYNLKVVSKVLQGYEKRWIINRFYY